MHHRFFYIRNHHRLVANSWMLCFHDVGGRARPDTRVCSAAKSSIGPSSATSNQKHSWSKWSLTHTGDSVVGEVAAFTLALETTANVDTFLVAPSWKFRIGTLVDVCAVT